MTNPQRPLWNGDDDYRVQREEPVLEWLQDDLRVVRCGYGAKVLESQNAMMLDFDCGKHGFEVNLKDRRSLSAWFYDFWTKAELIFPSCEWAAYVTKSGVRVIEVSGYEFDWENELRGDVRRYTTLGKETHADPVYIELSKRMKDFRLRVSPKPFRVVPRWAMPYANKYPKLYLWLQDRFVSHAYFDSTIPVDEFASHAAVYHHGRANPHYSPYHLYA